MEACLLLGSNLGDREAYLAGARECIERDCGKIVKKSKIYETEPWGFEADTPFLNQVLLSETVLSPNELLRRCLHIESVLGRERPTAGQPIASGRTMAEQTAGSGAAGECTVAKQTAAAAEQITRQPSAKYTSRTMDIDILFYDKVVCKSPDLTLPHPRLHLRTFALELLCEVDPEWVHPLFHLTVKELLKKQQEADRFI